jgi:pyrroline-5-carboxylate reductase
VEAVRLDRLGPLWVVGCGNMGGALLDRWLACGLDPASVTVIDPNPRAAPAGIRVVATAADAGTPPALLLLAVKPQAFNEVADQLAGRLDPAPLVISILAGTRATTLERLSPRVVRAMPNLPVRIGQGTTALYGGEPADRAVSEALMAAAGHAHWIDDEALFDTVTGLSGSGPAYLFRFIEALAEAGAAAGLPPAIAAGLALDTVTGAAALAAERAASPADLRAQVTSPNGTTAAGLAVLDGEGGLTALLTATVAAAARRSRELAATAASPAAPGSSAGPPAG